MRFLPWVRGHIARPHREAVSLTAQSGARYASRCAGVMKWQTCQTQNLVGGNARVGSSPTAGIDVLSMNTHSDRVAAGPLQS